MKRTIVVLGVLLFAGLLIGAIVALPSSPVDLRIAVASHLPEIGVSHPVTAVLLNFRGYDTLLEIAVLLLALVGLLAAGPTQQPPPCQPADAVLQMLARIATPAVILVGGYLLWAGAFRPGGAFQAGAVLAAAMVLLHLSGLLTAWSARSLALARRVALVGGFMLFLCIAVALVDTGSLLQYPREQAGWLILLIESGLTLSLATILAGLFLFLSRHGGETP